MAECRTRRTPEGNIVVTYWGWPGMRDGETRTYPPDGGVFHGTTEVCLPDEKRSVWKNPDEKPTPTKINFQGNVWINGARLICKEPPDPFTKWPKCHKCSKKADKYVAVQDYRIVGREDYGMTLRVKVECHGEKWTHTVRESAVRESQEPYALFAPGYDD